MADNEIQFHYRGVSGKGVNGVVSLAELPVGGRGVVVRVERGGASGRRLADLGLLPGTAVLCRRRAPLGDPRVYELRGGMLCLRRSEALAVRVQPL